DMMEPVETAEISEETTAEALTEAPTEGFETTEVDGSRVKPTNTKKKLKKLTLNDLLEVSCWNPDNFSQWEKWNKEQANSVQKGEDVKPYSGVRRYDIQLHCTQYVIRARKHSNGGYQILDFI